MFGLNETILSVLTNMRNWNMENTSVVYPIYPRTGNKSDGNFSPASNVSLTKNVYQWDTVNIPAGVTVSAAAPGLLILANAVTISGLLTASGLGGLGGQGAADSTPGEGEDGAGLVGGGGGGGGLWSSISVTSRGGNGRALGGVTSGPWKSGTVGTADVPAAFNVAGAIGLKAGGGGGGAVANDSVGGNGGHGGGLIVIVAKIITISGAIRAEGLSGTTANGSGGGGGGGGAIVLDAYSIQNAGVLSVAGGDGGEGTSPGGAGGDGCKLIVQRGLR